MHRIAWIDAQIREGRYPNATTIAKRFEISRRQASRDVEYLRYSMGAPVEYSQQRNGYFYSDETFVLPGLVVSEPDRSALAYLAERYSSLDDDTASRVGALLRRMAAGAVASSDVPVVDVDSREVALGEAIGSRRKVSVRYRLPDGIVVTRTLHPYAIYTQFGSQVCIGYCEELAHTVNLALARFERVDVGQECFEPPQHKRGGDWGRFNAKPEPFVATVRLGDDRDIERFEAAAAAGDGTCRIEFTDARAVVSALLSCPGGFEVLSPRWLRARVRERLEELLGLHHQLPG